MTTIGYLMAAIGGVFIGFPILYVFLVLLRIRSMRGMKIWEAVNGAGLMVGTLPFIGAAIVSYSASLLGFQSEEILPISIRIGIPILALATASSIIRLTFHYGFNLMEMKKRWGCLELFEESSRSYFTRRYSG